MSRYRLGEVNESGFFTEQTLSISLGPPQGLTDQQTGSSRTRTGTGKRDSRSAD